ncbi:MAG: universal stress protein [Myxococcales bacterium]
MAQFKRTEWEGVARSTLITVPANDADAANRPGGGAVAGSDGTDGTAARGGQCWTGLLPIKPRRILVGIDFSPAAESGRRLAVSLALATGAELDLVHVFDAFTESFLHRDPQVQERGEAILEDIDGELLGRERMARWQGVTCFHQALVGAPGRELARRAVRTGADLMVLGATRDLPGPFGWTWGLRALRQLLQASSWKGLILLRSAAP